MTRALVMALVLAAAAGCVRAPKPFDVAALVARRGPVEARRDLAIRVLDHPRDVQARLALARLAEQVGRPSEAIDQLEAVLRLGGPLGTRWHADDRRRLGRLLLARGRARLARSSPTALADLTRANSLDVRPAPGELQSAEVALASARLRHVDAKERALGRIVLARQATSAAGSASMAALWLGARTGATPAERGAFGQWLWTIGARREAYEQLVAWHAKTTTPRDEALQGAYLRALAWWSPAILGEERALPVEDLVGPERCWFRVAECAPPIAELPALPPVVEGSPAVRPPPVVAAARYATTRLPGAPPPSLLADVAAAYLGEAAIADRLARDLVAGSVDAAIAHGALGALFDALGDRTRARAAWQAAVDASEEPVLVRGLAEAAARGGDGPAAHVFAFSAAASFGDPAVVWNAVAAGLLEARQHVDALTAARRSLELAGPEELPRAIDLAIRASRLLGRTSQADALALQGAALATRRVVAPEAGLALAEHAARPTADTVERLWTASRATPRDVQVRAILHGALAPSDPRRSTIVVELIELAGDSNDERAYAAVRALRRTAQ
jgi:tetratricopeptide (TPR) repeat protein